MRTYTTPTFHHARLALLCVGLMSACAPEYRYTPPSTEEGRRCVERCQAVQRECREVKDFDAEKELRRCEHENADKFSECDYAAQEKYETCETEAAADFKACQKYSSTPANCLRKTCAKDNCYRASCYQSADYSFCESDFRLCFQNCGGHVEIKQ